MLHIYFRVEGEKDGPYTVDEVRQGLVEGWIPADVLACDEKAEEWMPAKQLLAALDQPRSEELLQPVNAPSLVSVVGVTKSFGNKIALRNISFSIPPGQICGLLGPNGAGKTTLFRLLMGILKATDGALLVDGLDAFEKRIEVKRLIGFLPDEPVFYSYLSGARSWN